MKFSIVSVFDTLSKQSRIIMIGDKTYVVKDYASDIGLLKWYMITLSNLAIRIYPFALEPRERMMREVVFMKTAEKCFSKPEIMAIDYGRLKLIRAYVKGSTYSFTSPINIHYNIGYNLGLCHETEWVLGDTKISNFIHTDTSVYIVDAEQAVKKCSPEYAGWDLLVLVSTLFMEGYVKAISIVDESNRILENILRGYVNGFSKWREVLEVLRTSEFKLLIYLLVPFPTNYLFIKKIEEIIGK